MTDWTGAGSTAATTGTAYATYDNVTVLCPRIFNAPSGAPTTDEVNDWLEEGYAIINAYLSDAGYSTPVASTAGVYKMLTRLNAVYAAGIVEMTRTVATTAPNENSRGAMYEVRFENGVKNLLKLDLSAQGISYTSSMYIGGISESDKESVENDTDRIMTSFRRGQHAYPGAGTTNSEVPEDSEERAD